MSELPPSPYNLTIFVESAENLPLADKPYALVVIDEKIKGRTNTSPKNISFPTWQTRFDISLNHQYHTICIKIYDEGKSRKDDFLGLVCVDLSSLSKNKVVPFTELLSDTTNSHPTKGKLTFSLLLKRNKNIIRVIPKSKYVDFGLDQEANISLSPLEFLSRKHATLLAHGGLFTEFRDIAAEVDGFVDLYGLSCSKVSEMFSFPKPISRASRQYMSSSGAQRDIHSSSIITSIHSGSPIKECGVQFYPSDDASQQVTPFLEFPNRYCLWSWLAWLRLAQKYGRGEISDDEPLGQFIAEKNGKLVMKSLQLYVGDAVYSGQFSLSFDNINLLQCEDTTTGKVIYTLDMSFFKSMSIAPDSLTWRPNRLQINKMAVRSTAGPRTGTGTGKGKDASSFPMGSSALVSVSRVTKSLRSFSGDVPALSTGVQNLMMGVGASAEGMIKRGVRALFLFICIRIVNDSL